MRNYFLVTVMCAKHFEKEAGRLANNSKSHTSPQGTPRSDVSHCRTLLQAGGQDCWRSDLL